MDPQPNIPGGAAVTCADKLQTNTRAHKCTRCKCYANRDARALTVPDGHHAMHKLNE